ncbi:hypothetical protein, partial [Hyphomonas oceanitis]
TTRAGRPDGYVFLDVLIHAESTADGSVKCVVHTSITPVLRYVEEVAQGVYFKGDMAARGGVVDFGYYDGKADLGSAADAFRSNLVKAKPFLEDLQPLALSRRAKKKAVPWDSYFTEVE